MASHLTFSESVVFGKQSNWRGLPHVGRIGTASDTSAMSWNGCDNHILTPRFKSISDYRIFLSRADGQIAWMNLDGHSVELKLVKQTFWYRADGHAFTRNEYRSGKTLILVSYPQYTDYISDYPAKIILRRGGATRTILATGQPLCD